MEEITAKLKHLHVTEFPYSVNFGWDIMLKEDGPVVRPGAGQCGGNFARDMSAFAHARHHHTASRVEDAPAGGCKGRA